GRSSVLERVSVASSASMSVLGAAHRQQLQAHDALVTLSGTRIRQHPGLARGWRDFGGAAAMGGGGDVHRWSAGVGGAALAGGSGMSGCAAWVGGRAGSAWAAR